MDAMKLESHVRELMAEKSQIEEEIEEQLLVLRGLGIGMNEPLVDRDGFPRADLDIAGARYARSRVVRLRNDLEAKMAEIGAGLNALHEARRFVESAQDRTHETPPNIEQPRRPLATVTGIAPGSPADEAGLKRGDEIMSIGTVDAQNAKDLPSYVKAHENESVEIVIRREGKPLTASIKPRLSVAGQWKGLLGIAMTLVS